MISMFCMPAAQADDKAELALLEHCREQLDQVGALDHLEPTGDEAKLLGSFAFLTQKPSLTVANIGEGQLGDEAAVTAPLAGPRRAAIAIAAEIERELLDLDADERELFMGEYGLAELRSPRLVGAALEALDLITFYTGGDKDTRAWLIPRGTTAVGAAGEVHTDIARGFIRAEVAAIDDLRVHGSYRELRAHGKERLEGKDYVVQAGDVINVRFSV